jgi:glutamyl-tRNA reductase
MIGVIGISFKSAELEIREKYAFSADDIRNMLELSKHHNDFRGMLIISTCNRTEIYFHCRKLYEHESYNMVLSALKSIKNFKQEHLQYFYFKHSQNAVDHLFRVASGIDSMVLGEDQIIGQVKCAYQLAIENNTLDTILQRLFTKAFEAAKKVKTNTSISQGSASVSSAAVDLCQKFFPNLDERNLLLIGAGQTGRLVLTSLGKRRFKSVCVANRTIEKAGEIASQFDGKGIGLDKIADYLPQSDIVIVATDSKNYLIDQLMIQNMKPNNLNFSKKLFIDLSVPRNIDPQVAETKDIHLYAVDNLTEIVNQTTQKRTEAISSALKILGLMSDEFMDWLVVRGLAPIFEKIKTNFQQIHQGEFETFVKINGINDQKAVEEYGKHISDKYARMLIKNLRNMVKSGESKDSIQAINELFELAN